MMDFYKLCKNGDTDLVRSTIKKLLTESGSGPGPGPISKSKLNNGLIGACYGNRIEIAQLIIDLGAYDFDQGLVAAVSKGNVNLINLMIMYGADVRRGLFEACKKKKHIDLVKLMIKDNNISNNDLNNCLRVACSKGHLNIIKLLIDHGADDFTGGLVQVAVYFNYKKDSIDTIQLLIDNGADFIKTMCGGKIFKILYECLLKRVLMKLLLKRLALVKLQQYLDDDCISIVMDYF